MWETEPNMGNNIGVARKRISNSPSVRGSTNSSSEVDINKKLTLTKYFNADLLVINDQNDFQDFLSQFNLNFQGNEYAWDKGTETITTVKLHHHVHQFYPYHFQAEHFSWY